MANINNSIFKQYIGSLDKFKTYYENLDDLQKAALTTAVVFIHESVVDDQWDGNGYIFANGMYYACGNTNLTANVLLSLIKEGTTNGVKVEVEGDKLIFTPVLKEELKALTNVGFVTSGKIWSAGTDLETILNDIFAKEVWYKADFTYTDNLVVSMNTPSLVVTVDGVTATSGSNYEIGASVSVESEMYASSYTGGTQYTVTCSTADNNGFVKNGDTTTKLTSLVVPATVSTGDTVDSLSITSKTKCFANVAVSSNSINASNLTLQSGDNTLTIKSSSKDYTLTAAPTSDMVTLTTLSNKGKYYTDSTKDGVSIKHSTSKTITEDKNPTNTITLKGAYKYYYVWGAASLPTIPTNFSGDLDGWTENWGSTTVNSTATTLNGSIYVLKPVNAAPSMNDAMGIPVLAAAWEKKGEYTNKFGTTYYLYYFGSNGSKYSKLVL